MEVLKNNRVFVVPKDKKSRKNTTGITNEKDKVRLEFLQKL